MTAKDRQQSDTRDDADRGPDQDGGGAVDGGPGQDGGGTIDGGPGQEAERGAGGREEPLADVVADVGSGPKSATDLSRERALAAFERVLDGDADPTALGAFLLANRWKGNTPEELAAYLDAVRARTATAAPTADPVDCGANYDGKTETAVLGVAAGVVAAAAGTPVVVHSADRVPTTEGVTYRHVLDELGVPTALHPRESAAMVDEVGFGFYYRPRFAPAVTDLLERRNRVGVRTAMNTVETLVNPARASAHLGSFYHLAFAHRVVDALRASRTVGVDRVVMVQGLEGYDDVRPGTAAVAEFDGTETHDREFETADAGFDADRAALAVDDVAAESAALTWAVLTGRRTGPVADAVAVNAGLRMYARGDATSPEAGARIARDTIDDGAAAATLLDLVSFEP